VTFQARASGGATKVVYQWDFDAADGLQVDAEGRQVRFRFRKPGTFTVTLTVRDAYGLKTPYSTTLKVVVN
jgi:PKD repeat protein